MEYRFSRAVQAGLVAHDVAKSPEAQNMLIESTVAGYGASTDVKTCAHCTYVNHVTQTVCQMCGIELHPVGKTSNVDELLERIQALEEATLCVICEEHVKDTVFGCGHETCTTCTAKLTECPQCRIPIATRIRRYV
ncbi:hypothetical protein DYB32_009743 [Aphanomyces invadans]|uniref:RING-type domain-containing protein n=1 Tax=Aphanomyces invadans TaxID=157072 RepID=A0A3R7A2I5_9STRA|nr:hypothetical protein DYB32_009743 [Aphanomyces invadans]